MKKDNYNYWIRTSLGLENIVLDELREKIKVNKYLIKHRSVFVEIGEHIKNEQSLFTDLRTADDIYKFLGSSDGIDKTKRSIDSLLLYFRRNIIPIIQKYKDSTSLRITVSFLGERNFNRFFVEKTLNELVAAHTHLKVLSSEKAEPRETGELRLRCHIENTQAFLGIAIFDTPLHRREWRVDTYNAQLSPPVAAAMARIARKLAAKKIIDPFCGSGTILIESAIVNPNISHSGFDINREALELAKKRARIANVDIEFYNKSAFDPTIDYKGNIIISNPPWGNKHEIGKNENKFFVPNLHNIILNSDGAVIIIPEDLAEQLKSEGLDLQEMLRTRIRGKLALIVMFQKH